MASASKLLKNLIENPTHPYHIYLARPSDGRWGSIHIGDPGDHSQVRAPRIPYGRMIKERGNTAPLPTRGSAHLKDEALAMHDVKDAQSHHKSSDESSMEAP
jgi:hypothetical protein